MREEVRRLKVEGRMRRLVVVVTRGKGRCEDAYRKGTNRKQTRMGCGFRLRARGLEVLQIWVRFVCA